MDTLSCPRPLILPSSLSTVHHAPFPFTSRCFLNGLVIVYSFTPAVSSAWNVLLDSSMATHPSLECHSDFYLNVISSESHSLTNYLAIFMHFAGHEIVLLILCLFLYCGYCSLGCKPCVERTLLTGSLRCPQHL